MVNGKPPEKRKKRICHESQERDRYREEISWWGKVCRLICPDAYTTLLVIKMDMMTTKDMDSIQLGYPEYFINEQAGFLA